MAKRISKKVDEGIDWPDVALVFVKWLTRHTICEVTILLAVLTVMGCLAWRLTH